MEKAPNLCVLDLQRLHFVGNQIWHQTDGLWGCFGSRDDFKAHGYRVLIYVVISQHSITLQPRKLDLWPKEHEIDQGNNTLMGAKLVDI